MTANISFMLLGFLLAFVLGALWAAIRRLQAEMQAFHDRLDTWIGYLTSTPDIAASAQLPPFPPPPSSPPSEEEVQSLEADMRAAAVEFWMHRTVPDQREVATDPEDEDDEHEPAY